MTGVLDTVSVVGDHAFAVVRLEHVESDDSMNPIVFQARKLTAVSA